MHINDLTQVSSPSSCSHILSFSGGGGGGGYVSGVVHLTAGQVLSIIVGSGGASNNPYIYSDGRPGGMSSVSIGGSVLFMAEGGGGGEISSVLRPAIEAPGGRGGSGSVADVVLMPLVFDGGNGGLGAPNALIAGGGGGSAGACVEIYKLVVCWAWYTLLCIYVCMHVGLWSNKALSSLVSSHTLECTYHHRDHDSDSDHDCNSDRDCGRDGDGDCLTGF
jgi:hypothetical protein